jgi:hypothetical protein
VTASIVSGLNRAIDAILQRLRVPQAGNVAAPGSAPTTTFQAGGGSANGGPVPNGGQRQGTFNPLPLIAFGTAAARRLEMGRREERQFSELQAQSISLMGGRGGGQVSTWATFNDLSLNRNITGFNGRLDRGAGAAVIAGIGGFSTQSTGFNTMARGVSALSVMNPMLGGYEGTANAIGPQYGGAAIQRQIRVGAPTFTAMGGGVRNAAVVNREALRWAAGGRDLTPEQFANVSRANGRLRRNLTMVYGEEAAQLMITQGQFESKFRADTGRSMNWSNREDRRLAGVSNTEYRTFQRTQEEMTRAGDTMLQGESASQKRVQRGAEAAASALERLGRAAGGLAGNITGLASAGAGPAAAGAALSSGGGSFVGSAAGSMVGRAGGNALFNAGRIGLGAIGLGGLATGAAVTAAVGSVVGLGVVYNNKNRQVGKNASWARSQLSKASNADLQRAYRSTHTGFLDRVSSGLFGEDTPKSMIAAEMKSRGMETGDGPGSGSTTGGETYGALSSIVQGLGGRVTSTTGGGHSSKSYHYKGQAVDVAGQSKGDHSTMLRINQTLAQQYGAGLKELIYGGPGATNIKDGKPFNYSAAILAQHKSHVHVAADPAGLKKGGIPLSGGGGGVGQSGGGNWTPIVVGRFVGNTTNWSVAGKQQSYAAAFAGGGTGASNGSAGASPSGSVNDWITQALGVLGLDSSKYGKALSTIIQHESGGDPHAQNNWDANAKRGTPSKGLMQTIDSTFNKYKMPGHEDIWNPVDNIIAATRYALSRYGSMDNVPGIKSLNSGGGYKGYAKGAWEVGSDQMAYIHKGEMIVPDKDASAIRAAAKNPFTTRGGGGRSVILNFHSGSVVLQSGGQAEARAFARMVKEEIEKDQRYSEIGSS